jgi:prolyl oligopeptidase
VYALPNLRGGGEYGEVWHRAGMRENKQNVFDDFFAAAEYLIQTGYTSPAHLGIRGGSNGGLLVGAAMVQRPELFGAVVCAVPLLDMVRYHEFGLGRAWIPEYGDPDVETDFRWLYAYSPYHQLRADRDYPPLLMMSADTDDRVDPMHARKFVAKMLATPGVDADAVWLWVERNAGHGGADLRKAQVERRADEYAFLWKHLGGVPRAQGVSQVHD